VKSKHRLSLLAQDRTYRRIWLVGACGNVAIWLEMLVVGIFAFDATRSPLLVALLVVLRLLPLAIFGPMIGTFADRAAPRLMLLVTLSTAAVVSAATFGLFLAGHTQYLLLAISSFASGMVWSTEMPLRRRILGDIAGPERLAAAMGLDSATSNITRTLGPLLGGALYEWLGIAGAFAVSASLYVVSVAAVVGLSSGAPAGHARRAVGGLLNDFREAFAFVAREPDILRILLVTVVFNVWGFPFVSMIPVIGREDFALSAGWIGVLASMEGFGAFLGALLVAMRVRVPAFRRVYYGGVLGYLVLVFLVGSMGRPLPAGVVLICVGLSGACFSAMQGTLIYSVAPARMRSRLLGLMALCIGAGVLGFANMGLMGQWLGGSAAIRVAAAEGLVPLLAIGLGWRQLRSPAPDDRARSTAARDEAP
jgi:MFS family permease